MGLTERHWFEDEERELTEQELEDRIDENRKAYEQGWKDAMAKMNKEEKRNE